MFDNLYCKLYIKTDKSIEQVSNEIGGILDLTWDKYNSFEGDFYTLDIIINKEYDIEKSKEFQDGFLYFNYFLDLNCKEEKYEDEYINLISDLMKKLWGGNMILVASCDFEERLPHKGGYKHRINY